MSISTDHRVFDRHEFLTIARISRRDATLGDDFGRRPAAARDGDGNFIFIIFRDRPFSRAQNRAPKYPGAYIFNSVPHKRRSYVSLRDRSTNVTRDIPRSARMRHVSSSIYNCCPPRNFCVVEKRTLLLLRLSERPGRPRFVNNSLIKQISHFFCA